MAYQSIPNAVESTLTALDQAVSVDPSTGTKFTVDEITQIIAAQLKTAFRNVAKKDRHKLGQELARLLHSDTGDIKTSTTPFATLIRAQNVTDLPIQVLNVVRPYVAEIDNIYSLENLDLLWNKPFEWPAKHPEIASKLFKSLQDASAKVAATTQRKLDQTEEDYLAAVSQGIMAEVMITVNDIWDDILETTLFTDHKRYAQPAQFIVQYFVHLPIDIVLYTIGYAAIIPALLYYGVIKLLETIESVIRFMLMPGQYDAEIKTDTDAMQLTSDATALALFRSWRTQYGEAAGISPEMAEEYIPQEVKAQFKGLAEPYFNLSFQLRYVIHSKWIISAAYHQLSAPLSANALEATGSVLLRMLMAPALAALVVFSVAIDILKVVGLTVFLGLEGALFLTRTLVTLIANLPLYIYEGADSLVNDAFPAKKIRQVPPPPSSPDLDANSSSEEAGNMPNKGDGLQPPNSTNGAANNVHALFGKKPPTVPNEKTPAIRSPSPSLGYADVD